MRGGIGHFFRQITTWRSRFLSTARWTSPIPPYPIFSRISYRSANTVLWATTRAGVSRVWVKEGLATPSPVRDVAHFLQNWESSELKVLHFGHFMSLSPFAGLKNI